MKASCPALAIGDDEADERLVGVHDRDGPRSPHELWPVNRARLTYEATVIGSDAAWSRLAYGAVERVHRVNPPSASAMRPMVSMVSAIRAITSVMLAFRVGCVG
jgi:hypothetical protein